MPKETIYDEIADGFRVEVGWANDRYVQIATTNQKSPLALPCEDQPPQPPQPAGVPENVVADNPPPDGNLRPFYGWSVTLDREGINRLIRTLRRARNSAYGHDE